MIEIKRTLTLKSEDIKQNEKFVVTSKINGPAIILAGDSGRNRIDGYFPSFELDCQNNSDGVLINRVDNAVISSISVKRATGFGIKVVSCRQSNFQTLHVNECGLENPLEPAISIESQRIASGDANNCCNFDFLSAIACVNDTILNISAGTAPLNTVRSVNMNTVFIHCWYKGCDERYSQVKKQIYANINKVYRLYMYNIHIKTRPENTTFESIGLNLTSVTGSRFIGVVNTEPTDRVISLNNTQDIFLDLYSNNKKYTI